MKYFDYKVSLKKEKTLKDIKDKAFDISDNLHYKSNKLLFSNGKKYLNKYDYFVGRDYTGDDHAAIDDPRFWEDQDHLRIYEKSVDKES